jgi:DNA-directed RNA polymerase specialized sigma54-like protein
MEEQEKDTTITAAATTTVDANRQPADSAANPIADSVAVETVDKVADAVETVDADAVEKPKPVAETPSLFEEVEQQQEQQPTTPSAAEIEAMIAEAEQRGYLRGRNENIEQLMQRPGMLERASVEQIAAANADSPMILTREHISIWDR